MAERLTDRDRLRVAEDYGTQQYVTAARTQSRLSLAEGRIAKLEAIERAARAYFREFDHLIGPDDYPERAALRAALKGKDAK